MSLLGTYDWISGSWRAPLITAGWANSASGFGIERVVGGYTLRIGTPTAPEGQAMSNRDPRYLIATLQPGAARWGDTDPASQPETVDTLYAPSRVRVYDGGAFVLDLTPDGFSGGFLCVEPEGAGVYGLLSFGATIETAYGAAWGLENGKAVAPGAVGFSATPEGCGPFRRVLAYALPPCGSLVDANTILIDPPMLIRSDTSERLHTFVNILPPSPFAGVLIGGRRYNLQGVATT